MNTVKIGALGVFVVLIGAQCFGAAVKQSQAELNEGLIRAARRDIDEDIDDYLNRGAEIGCVGASSNTPLMTAIMFDCTNAIQKLLDRRASVNAQDGMGCTPLMRAARKGNLELVRILLDRGALVNVEDIGGWTALMCAARFADEDQRTNDKYFNIIRVLVRDGKADISLVNKQGETALDMVRKNFNNDERIFALLAMGG